MSYNCKLLDIEYQSIVRCIMTLNTKGISIRFHSVMAHSFKTISKAFGGSGLILEGLIEFCKGWDEIFCLGFPGVNPQRSDHGDARWNFF